ncbi:glycosyltransferase family 1 protein [Leptolyngbya ohadii]|uniref:glycosyltransferase family 1 protein n=1 Tax=Leptolyngbya ohadii TaxID=1962290 RepID=UPI00117BBAEE|nr:glycosyltransferase family 1 protein [Leptolyngbya ohadii]
MAKILILTGAHLCTAPRPQKEADSLSAAGHEVIVRGIWFDPVLVDRDRHLMHQNIMRQKPWKFLPVLDFRPDRPSPMFTPPKPQSTIKMFWMGVGLILLFNRRSLLPVAVSSAAPACGSAQDHVLSASSHPSHRSLGSKTGGAIAYLYGM